MTDITKALETAKRLRELAAAGKSAAKFYVAARNDTPALCDAVEALADRVRVLEIAIIAQGDRISVMKSLVKCLIDEDPNDMAADGVTVLEVWRKEARAALAEKE